MSDLLGPIHCLYAARQDRKNFERPLDFRKGRNPQGLDERPLSTRPPRSEPEDQETAKKDLQPISHAQTLRRAQQAVKRFVRYWQTLYFKATH